ncbi:DUF6786 family protein [Telluribacter sp.]|jgi:hypothetical protein|uniref:DUF6786 family protein n=1 Tax=Telluribacter sp. TaxID=1978767 RepID=UPI002E1397BA|nr:DUF6786 family protein [Telluribacter sp.]
MQKSLILAVALAVLLSTFSCQTQQTTSDHSTTTQDSTAMEGTFGYDVAFLKKQKEIILLQAPDNAMAQAVLVPDYQGRVMTSTAGGTAGNSYGWLNYAHISSGQSTPHMNAYGGEERFWLSPEGGQFSVYFEKDKPFTFENWQTPALIDSESFEVVRADAGSALFRKQAELENYSGTRFSFDIEREIRMLDKGTIQERLGITLPEGVQSVAYESSNTLINRGDDWQRDEGVLGIWILGMFKPTEQTTIIAPVDRRQSNQLLLTDNYFGKIPADRLRVTNSAVLLRADGRYRSKIGLAAQSARPVAGSYDAEKGILTLVQYDLNPQGDYLKSSWEIHKDPYLGDALNAYNDGPLEDGSQMGPFYELESNSSVKALKKGESLVHHHRTFHFEGDIKALSDIASKVLGLDLASLKND